MVKIIQIEKNPLQLIFLDEVRHPSGEAGHRILEAKNESGVLIELVVDGKSDGGPILGFQ